MVGVDTLVKQLLVELGVRAVVSEGGLFDPVKIRYGGVANGLSR